MANVQVVKALQESGALSALVEREIAPLDPKASDPTTYLAESTWFVEWVRFTYDRNSGVRTGSVVYVDGKQLTIQPGNPMEFRPTDGQEYLCLVFLVKDNRSGQLYLNRDKTYKGWAFPVAVLLNLNLSKVLNPARALPGFSIKKLSDEELVRIGAETDVIVYWEKDNKGIRGFLGGQQVRPAEGSAPVPEEAIGRDKQGRKIPTLCVLRQRTLGRIFVSYTGKFGDEARKIMAVVNKRRDSEDKGGGLTVQISVKVEYPQISDPATVLGIGNWDKIGSNGIRRQAEKLANRSSFDAESAKVDPVLDFMASSGFEAAWIKAVGHPADKSTWSIPAYLAHRVKIIKMATDLAVEKKQKEQAEHREAEAAKAEAEKPAEATETAPATEIQAETTPTTPPATETPTS